MPQQNISAKMCVQNFPFRARQGDSWRGVSVHVWKKEGKKQGVTKHKITVLETSYWDQKNCEAYRGGTPAIH